MSNFWKENWKHAQENLGKWWSHEGPAFCVMAPNDTPWADIERPPYIPPFCQPCFPKNVYEEAVAKQADDTPDLRGMWMNPAFRFSTAEYLLSRTFFGGEAFPYFDAHIGPGNLAAFLGSRPSYAEDTVWFNECMDELDNHPPLVIDENNQSWRNQLALITYAREHADGRFLVSMPDLIENVDILASLRGAQNALMDMALQPDSVKQRVREINSAFFRVFDRIYDIVKDGRGGNCYSCFHIWGQGRTAKIQCDLAAMLSPAMFNDIVAPALEEQCDTLDCVLFHLDGSEALQHLDTLLAMPRIDAIEWTPEPGAPHGGSSEWYELYRRILDAGKGVQAISVGPDEAEPMLDAVGAQGMYLTIRTDSETEAQHLLDKLERRRP